MTLVSCICRVVVATRLNGTAIRAVLYRVVISYRYNTCNGVILPVRSTTNRTRDVDVCTLLIVAVLNLTASERSNTTNTEVTVTRCTTNGQVRGDSDATIVVATSQLTALPGVSYNTTAVEEYNLWKCVACVRQGNFTVVLRILQYCICTELTCNATEVEEPNTTIVECQLTIVLEARCVYRVEVTYYTCQTAVYISVVDICSATLTYAVVTANTDVTVVCEVRYGTTVVADSHITCNTTDVRKYGTSIVAYGCVRYLVDVDVASAKAICEVRENGLRVVVYISYNTTNAHKYLGCVRSCKNLINIECNIANYAIEIGTLDVTYNATNCEWSVLVRARKLVRSTIYLDSTACRAVLNNRLNAIGSNDCTSQSTNIRICGLNDVYTLEVQALE